MKTVFKGKLFTIKQENVRMPDSATKIYEVCERPPTVIIIPFLDKRRIILLREYRRATNKLEWRLPAGRVDKERNVKKAAQRELREETGFKASELKLIARKHPVSSIKWNVYIFAASGLKPASLPKDVDERIKIMPVTLKQARDMAVRGDIENELMALTLIRLYHKLK